MKITADTTVDAAIRICEEKMSNTFAWLVPDLPRLQQPKPLRSVVGSVSVEQAARIARIPLTEALYVLNLAAGEPEDQLSAELRSSVLEHENLTDAESTNNNPEQSRCDR